MKTNIIFISGAPATGKSTIAKMLAIKLGVDKIVDLDVTKNIFQSFYSKELNPELYQTSHGAIKNGLMFMNDYFKCLQNILLKILPQFKKEKVIIVEGVQLTPEIINYLDQDIFITKYFLITASRKDIIKRINKKLKNRESNWLEDINEIIKIQDYLLSFKNQTVIKNKYKFLTLNKMKKGIKT